MQDTLEITPITANLIAETLTKRVSELDNQILVLKGQREAHVKIINQIKKILTSSTNKGDFQTEIDSVYNKEWSWLKRIQFVISEKGALTALNIVEVIMSEYHNDIGMEKKSVIANVSGILSLNSKDGDEKAIFLKAKNARGEYVYNLK